MSTSELYEVYANQGTVSCASHEDIDDRDGHMDIGGPHFDYPHGDYHTDE